MISPRPCRGCGGEFEISDSALKKRNYICKPCRKVETRKGNLRKKSEGKKVSGSRMPLSYHREYDKEYRKRPDVKKRRLDGFYKRLQGDEERWKYEARKETRNAIRRGDIIKQPCEVCGNTKVDAHHDDYSKPLEVRFLCRKHHSEHHAKARGET